MVMMIIIIITTTTTTTITTIMCSRDRCGKCMHPLSHPHPQWTRSERRALGGRIAANGRQTRKTL